MSSFQCIGKIGLILFYIACYHVNFINSRTSSLWKLNPKTGKINSYTKDVELQIQMDDGGQDSPQAPYDNDPIFEIITSTVSNYGPNSWTRHSKDKHWNNLSMEFISANDNIQNSASITVINSSKPNQAEESLSCGKPVNFTYYDDLIGIAQRFSHPITPEPEVAYLFMKKKEFKYLKNFDVQLLEKKLKKAKKENPRSVQLYNQIGNFWRIKGDTKQAIECFRKALAITPTNSDVLLNLARVLFHMQYLDDAIHLTRLSLEVQTPDRSAWRQYFTLGEIFKAYGHFQESILHLKHALELHPNHELISKALRDVENIPNSHLHNYTILIIVCLVMSVLLAILSSADNFSSSSGSNSSTDQIEHKHQRHFNRAMAMRSLKGFASSRSIKYRK